MGKWNHPGTSRCPECGFKHGDLDGEFPSGLSSRIAELEAEVEKLKGDYTVDVGRLTREAEKLRGLLCRVGSFLNSTMPSAQIAAEVHDATKPIEPTEAGEGE